MSNTTKKKRLNNNVILDFDKPPSKPKILDEYKTEDDVKGISNKARYRMAKLAYEEQLNAWNAQLKRRKRIQSANNASPRTTRTASTTKKKTIQIDPTKPIQRRYIE